MTPEILESLWKAMDDHDYGPVRPLGKTKDYDRAFDQVYEQFIPAVRQGCLEIIKPAADVSAKINSEATYKHFKNLAFNKEVIAAASQGIDKKLLRENSPEVLAPSGSEDSKPMFKFNLIGDYFLSDTIDTSPIYQGPVGSEEERILISKMCHARIGSIVKNLMICDQAGLQPFATDQGIASVLQLVNGKFNQFIEKYQMDADSNEFDLEELNLLRRLDEFAFSEYIDAKVLEGMSVKHVLKTRTKAWKKFSEGRADMTARLRRIALENSDEIKFRSALEKLLVEFKKEAGDYEHEASKLNIKTAFQIGGGVAGGTTLIQKFLSAPSLDMLLTLGVPGLLIYGGSVFIPQLLDLMRRNEKLKELSGYSLYSPYREFFK